MNRKTILITGGSKGIGRSIALKFAKNGFDIITCGRNVDDLKKLKAEVESIGESIYTEVCDLRSKSQIESFVHNGINTFGRIDVLVNNAGVFIPGKIQDEEDGVFEEMMEINLNGTYYTTRYALKHIPEFGQIFNICSTASITPYINGGSYCISKYAQYGMTKVLREELKSQNIKVTAVLPGATLTASWEGTELPKERFIQPETVAEMVWNCYKLPNEVVVEDLLIRPMQGDIT